MLDVITILRVTAATAFSISFFHLHPEAHDARYSTHQLDMPDGTGSHSVRLLAWYSTCVRNIRRRYRNLFHISGYSPSAAGCMAAQISWGFGCPALVDECDLTGISSTLVLMQSLPIFVLVAFRISILVYHIPHVNKFVCHNIRPLVQFTRKRQCTPRRKFEYL